MAEGLNKNRLHLLVSGVVATGLLVYLASFVPDRHRDFVREYEGARIKEYIEKQTGLPYERWYWQRVAECSRPEYLDKYDPPTSSGIFESKEDRERREEGCVSGVTLEQMQYAHRGESMAVIRYGAPRLLGYLSAVLAASWAVGMLLAKLLPATFSNLWAWLHRP